MKLSNPLGGREKGKHIPYVADEGEVTPLVDDPVVEHLHGPYGHRYAHLQPHLSLVSEELQLTEISNAVPEVPTEVLRPHLTR